MQIAEGRMERSAKPKMHHMRVMPATGGVMVSEHDSPHNDIPMNKPKIFGKHEGDKLAAHLLRKAGIPGAQEEVGESEHQDMQEPVSVEE